VKGRPGLLLLRAVSLLVLLLAGPAAAAAKGEWTALGPEGGNATALAVSPDGVVWAGTSRDGGLFRSADRGASWKRVGGSLDHLSVLAVAIDPVQPKIVYVGTVDGGLFRSDDGGSHWISINQGLPSYSHGEHVVVRALSIDPRAPRRVFAATEAGLYLSRDRGSSWKQSLPYYIVTFALAPSDPRFVYAEGAGGSFRSTNGGLAWEPMETPDGIIKLAVHPTSPETIWAVTELWYTRPALWRSDDGGHHWEPIWIYRKIRTLLVDPGEPDSLWAGAEGGIVRIFDRGARRRFFPVSQGEDVISLAFDATDRRVLYAGTGWNDRTTAGYPGRQGGVWRSPDRGRTWQQGIRGMIATEIQAVVAPAPDRIVAALLGRGPVLSDGRGSPWAAGDHGVERDIHDLLADPAAPDILWAATWDGVFRSEDGGQTWTAASEGLTPHPILSWRYCTSLALDPTVPGGLWVASWSGLFHSADGARTWARVTSLPEAAFDAVAVDPNDPRKVWVASEGGGALPGVFRSEDGGATWQESPFAAYFLDALAVSPAGTLFVSTLTQLFRSTDGGITWQETSPSGIFSVAPDPADPGTIWAGGILGLYRSRDDGKTWETVTGGPGKAVILDLAPDSSGGLLVATRGHGLFRLTQEN
jgi:photosystem II stability/assembly factor-like uncharacterized protein